MQQEKTIDSQTDRPGFCFLYITPEQLMALGISKSTINRKLKNREWKVRETNQTQGRTRPKEILVSSLPVDIQIKWARFNIFPLSSNNSDPLLPNRPEIVNEHEKAFRIALLRLPDSERPIWIAEALRLSKIVLRYGNISCKRQRNTETGNCEFVPGVYELCEEAVCKDQVILAREPHRAHPPSPFTLDNWWREYKRIGLLVFLRSNPVRKKRIDKRRASISIEAVEWINSNWRTFKTPRYLYKSLKETAKVRNWRIPSESWIYRLYENIPEVVKILLFEGRNAYESKLAPYVPRDVSDLEALQVICGDHSERDVTVSLPNGTIARPWLTLWYDLRTGLIWGWHLSLRPSSYTAGLAYANGVNNFGAQPFSRPDDGFYSFIYTDRGRDYRSHNWDGKVIDIYKEVWQLDKGMETLLINHNVGIVHELELNHLLTKGHNPKENPVERVHGIISQWEENTFPEYCGRNNSKKPEQWLKLFSQYQQFKKGKLAASPFRTFDDYKDCLAKFIVKFNSSVHKRTTLGGQQIVPIDEYHRLYTIHYSITPQTLALLLMKAKTRTIGKDGVQLFQPNWFYYHEAMATYKRMSVEVRFSDDDYNRVWVVLPNYTICEAERIPPTSLINPDHRTLQAIRSARADERELTNKFILITQSNLRGETVEDRVAMQLEAEEISNDEKVSEKVIKPQWNVHKLTRFDRPKLLAVKDKNKVTAEDVKAAEADDSIFVMAINSNNVGELDDEELLEDADQ